MNVQLNKPDCVCMAFEASSDNARIIPLAVKTTATGQQDEDKNKKADPTHEYPGFTEVMKILYSYR